jgi:hypothetical protein
MRHQASLPILLLALGACATIPAFVRLDVDGSTVEYKKKAEPPAPAYDNQAAPANDAEPR